MKKVCEETSAIHPGVLFYHRRDEQQSRRSMRGSRSRRLYCIEGVCFAEQLLSKFLGVLYAKRCFPHNDVTVSVSNDTPSPTPASSAYANIVTASPPIVQAVAAASAPYENDSTEFSNPAVAPEYVPGLASVYPVAAVATKIEGESDIHVNVETGIDSRAERLRELDRIKGLLTESEYQGKRAEILSEV